MKKRLAVLLLAVMVLLCVIPHANGIGTLWFVAVNDTIPLTMTGDSEPFYSGETLYIPYSAFNAKPAGVVPALDTDKRTFALFTRHQRLVYNLATDTVTDETDAETEVSVYYRNGVLFVPSSAASHFGLSVSLLYSHGGYPVLRFKTGGQVYGDDEFLERADSVITYRAESTDAPEPEPSSPEMPPLHQPQEEEPPQTPLRYYPVLWSEAVSETNLKLLNNHEIRAAFFLTEEQIQNNRSLVRAICSAGHTVGVTVTAEETQVEEALARANDALDQVVFSKSMMALLHAGQTLMEDIYLTVSSDYVAAEGSTELLLVLTSADETARLQQLQTEEATFLHLRENTVIP